MREEMGFGKMLLVATVTMLVFVFLFYITMPAFATAYVLVEEYKAEKTTWQGEPCWLISFAYKGDILSYYADEKPNNSKKLIVEVWENNEVLDAGYLELQ